MSQDIASFAPRVAVLIDAENVSWKHSSSIVEALEQEQGPVEYKVYGRKEACKGWLIALKRHQPRRLSPVPTGKPNATDVHLMLDAMVYLLMERVQHMYLVSNDRDYLPLLRQLKSFDCKTTVIGDSQGSKPLRKACDEFVLLKKA